MYVYRASVTLLIHSSMPMPLVGELVTNLLDHTSRCCLDDRGVAFRVQAFLLPIRLTLAKIKYRNFDYRFAP